MSDDDSKGLVPLADAIGELRAELLAAIEKADGSRLRFDLKGIDLELNVVVTREGSGGGKVSFKLFGLGAEANLGGKISDAVTQKVKLTLMPKLDGADVQVNATVDRR
jgi:hypothetical protein